jgi:hypothetical protein
VILALFFHPADQGKTELTMLAQAAKSLFLKEFVGAFFLSMRYFFAPKAT